MKKKLLAGHHDRFFKQAYSDPLMARELFRLVFSKKEFSAFDWNSLKSEKDTFQDKRADLVFSVLLNNAPELRFKICILLEHKAQYNRDTFYQALSYQTLIIGQTWSQMREAWPVIPVLFSHGKKPWKGKRSFQQGFWGKSFAKIPVSIGKDMLNYGVRLLDTHDPKVSAVLKDKSFKSRGFLHTLKEVWNLKANEDLLSKAVFLFDNWPGDRDELLLSLGDYLWTAVPGMTEDLWKKVESKAVKEGIFSKGGYMNIKEYIREEGRQEGRQAERQQVILNMLKKSADLSFISEVTGLSVEEIKKLKNGKMTRKRK